MGRYPAGVPRDEPLVNDLRVYNNTPYNITSLTLHIIGPAVEPEPFNFTITLDPNVSAFFGDANGDGKTGLSDIFSTITVSADHRTITYSDGLIPVDGRFTDFIFSMTDNGEPFKAGVFTSFDGFLAVPEPATWVILLMGLGATAVIRRRNCGLGDNRPGGLARRSSLILHPGAQLRPAPPRQWDASNAWYLRTFSSGLRMRLSSDRCRRVGR